MKTLIRSILRVMTGRVIEQADTSIMRGKCQLSLRLKKNEKRGETYVVMAALSAGDYQYYPMDREEFDRFVEAAIEIRASLNAQ